MVRKYNITVNGTKYEVEVEEVADGVSSAAPATPAVPAAPAVAPAPAGNKGASVIPSPMPGTVIKTLVKPGESFKAGQVVLVLEAMKMENEITAPSDGVAVSVCSDGASVSAGDVLVSYN